MRLPQHRMGSHPNRMRRWFEHVRVEELSASDFRVKFRAGLNPGTWKRHGEQLIHDCAAHDKKVLLVIDELPILLKRFRDDGDARRVDEFLSWLRAVTQGLDGSPALIISGSIGLGPLVKRLGIPDRINRLDPFRLGPWDRQVSIECFESLAASHRLAVEDGVIHDGYLESTADGHRFLSRLLKDWWSARFRDHHTPLEQRP